MRTAVRVTVEEWHGQVKYRIRGQTRVSRGVKEAVQHSKGRCAMERKNGAIFGIGDRRRRGHGLLGGTGVHVLHRGDLVNDRAGVSVTRWEDTIRRMRKCISSAGRERGDKSARREWTAFKGRYKEQEAGHGQIKIGAGDSSKRKHGQHQQSRKGSSK